MSEELSPREDTTGSTYTDLGATTGEAYRISETSRKLARKRVGDRDYEDRVRQRCSIAVGDFEMAALLRFMHDPVNAGLRALGDQVRIITDIRMVQVGIQKKGHQSEILCSLDHADSAPELGITRSRAGIITLAGKINGSIIVIGNAPSALLSLCDLIKEGHRPALVVATPVGFVNAAESKALLRTLSVPSISNEGTRGGTPVAVAAINEIITIYAEQGVNEP